MPLKLIRNDITKVKADAIVNVAAPSLLGGGGGVDGAIHAAAGPELLAECRTLGGCAAGEAKITKGYGLPARYVIHTVGPVWTGGENGEESTLAACYRNSLALARERHLKSIAFPLIASGTFGYPKDKALQTAMAEISAFVLTDDMTVYLVVFDEKAFALSEQLFSSVKEYIDNNYVAEYPFGRMNSRGSLQVRVREMDLVVQEGGLPHYIEPARPRKRRPAPAPAAPGGSRSLDEVVGQLDETFSQMLLRLISERGLSDASVYRRANVDRRHFSKIRSDAHYTPKKATAIAFAIALELSLDETRDLLGRAGYALSPSTQFDTIIRYFIEQGIYDTFEINKILFKFDQTLLGA